MRQFPEPSNDVIHGFGVVQRRLDLVLWLLAEFKRVARGERVEAKNTLCSLLRYHAWIPVAQRRREHRSGIESNHVAYSDIAAYVG